jgi:hypothetical protein
MAKENDMVPPKKDMPQEMPLDLELDLLVDEELPEERRRELLKSLDRMPAHWRDLSIRFLERQVERRSARQLLKQGIVKLPERPQPVENFQFPRRTWFTPMRISAIAAGLLIAVTSAVVTTYVLNRDTATPPPQIANSESRDNPVDSRFVDTKLPGSVAGMEIPVKLSVVDVHDDARAAAIFQQGFDDGPGSRHSIVIKPDSTGNALVIPVKSLQIQ